MDETLRTKLMSVSVATLATALFKRGLRNQVIQGVHPVKAKGRNMVGPAFTLRYIPAREDRNQLVEFRRPDHPQRVAIESCPAGQVLVMDTFWDRQRYDIAAYCLINTSPYFNNLASGNSKVYESEDYIRLAKAAGLELVTARDGIGYCHSLLRFAKAA